MQTEQIRDIAAVVTEPGQNVALLSKEILKSLGVSEVKINANPNDTLELINRGLANMILIDDTAERPAPILLRQLLRNPLAPITPTIVLLSEQNKHEAAAISTLGRPMIINKPLTPGRFSPGFKTLKNVWAKGIFSEIKKAAILIANGHLEPGMQILTELTRNPKAQPVIAPTISLLLRQSGNLPVAEKILLAALKAAPRDLGLILSLSDLYMHAAMPFTALRLMKGVDAAYGETMASYMDKLQAYKMLGDLSSCIAVLQDMLGKQLFESDTREYLVRMLFSQGNLDEFLKQVKSDAKAHRFGNLWGKTIPAQPAIQAS